MPSHPMLSILIPNYNNGRASARDGRRDFIGDLLRSIDVTLRDDPTPVEILIADDGSTDDSPETIQNWIGRRGPGEAGGRNLSEAGCRGLSEAKTTRPNDLHKTRSIATMEPDVAFEDSGHGTWGTARYFPLEHRGVVSRCMNVLLREARGDIFCRFDGDIIIHTPNWASILCDKFERADPGVGVIGAKQLMLNGRVHSMGDWILHPRGYHHVGQGAPRQAFTQDLEVDHVMGCFYACRRAVYESVGDYDETILRGQTIDWTVSARSRGWRVICTPDIEFTHCHSERVWRNNEADTPAGLNAALDRFREKWGFDRLAPDLDAAASRHAGTPLLWNESVFNDSLAARFDAPMTLERSDWSRIAQEPAFRQSIAHRVQILMELLGQRATDVDPVIHLACGTGLLTHLLAEQGLNLIGADENPHALRIAETMCTRAACANSAPVFTTIGPQCTEDWLESHCRIALLADSIERHPNPVALFEHARRILADDGLLVVLTSERPLEGTQDPPAAHRYRAHELNAQIANTRQFRIHTPAHPRDDGLLVAVAEPVPFGAHHVHFRTEPKSDLIGSARPVDFSRR